MPEVRGGVAHARSVRGDTDAQPGAARVVHGQGALGKIERRMRPGEDDALRAITNRDRQAAFVAEAVDRGGSESGDSQHSAGRALGTPVHHLGAFVRQVERRLGVEHTRSAEGRQLTDAVAGDGDGGRQ